MLWQKKIKIKIKNPSICDSGRVLENFNSFSGFLRVGICPLTVTRSSDKGYLHIYMSSTTLRQLTTAQRTSSHLQIAQDKSRWRGLSVALQEAAVCLNNSKRLWDSHALKKLRLTLLFYFLFTSTTMWMMRLMKNHG